MLFSPAPLGVYAIVLLAFLLAISITNRYGCPRLLRIVARNGFVLTVLLLCYQVGMATFAPAARFLVFPGSVPAPPAASDSVVGGPSLSAAFVDQVLVAAGSPAVGTGQALYDLSVQYHVDDAYALATFWHESTYGKFGYAFPDHALGNIICAGYPTCNGRFRWYASWQEGYADFYRLIAREYVPRGLVTVAAIEPVYAPTTENDTSLYIRSVVRAMSLYRSGHII